MRVFRPERVRMRNDWPLVNPALGTCRTIRRLAACVPPRRSPSFPAATRTNRDFTSGLTTLLQPMLPRGQYSMATGSMDYAAILTAPRRDAVLLYRIWFYGTTARVVVKLPEDAQTLFDARQERILDAAAALLPRLGYMYTSTSAIATRANVSKATLYDYWPGKLQLFHALVVRDSLHVLDTWVARILADPR